jgi:hypothetical protein
MAIEGRGERKRGTVARVLRDYGFISCEDIPEKELYFKTSWFRGSPPLRDGDKVTCEVKAFEDKLTASFITRDGDERAPEREPERSRRDLFPRSPRLFDWAYFGYWTNVLGELSGLALKERWEFKNTPTDSEHPLPILHSYLHHTFGRLALERKVLLNEKAGFAAFNTGLVDHRYEPIHALFVTQDDPRAPWQHVGFCIAGEGANGQNLVRHFAPLPSPPHYFDSQMDLLYDTRGGNRGDTDGERAHAIFGWIDGRDSHRVCFRREFPDCRSGERPSGRGRAR